MTRFRRLIALLVLFALVCAGVHMASEHGSYSVVSSQTAHIHHHDHDSCPFAHHHSGEHYHDFNASASAVGAKHLLQTPHWVPLFEPDLVTALLRELRSTADTPAYPAPNDERTSGWLFVCRTALPVRAPALLA